METTLLYDRDKIFQPAVTFEKVKTWSRKKKMTWSLIVLFFIGFIALFVVLFFVRWTWRIISYSPVDYFLSIPFDRKIVYDPSFGSGPKNSFRWSTGDVLLFAGNNFGQRSLRGFIGSYFDHSAVIVMVENQAYVWEADIGQGFSKGVRLVSLEDKLKRFKGYKFVAWIPYQGDEISLEKMVGPIEKNLSKPIHPYRGLINFFLSRSIPKIWSVIRKKLFGSYFSDGKFCSELTIETLIDIGSINSEKVGLTTSWCPGDFLDLESTSYGDPWCIVF